MGFWIFMLVCNLFTPLVMMGVGWWMYKHPPKNVNMIIGYRTKRSMKSDAAWKFANEYCGKLWWLFGRISGVITLVVMMFLTDASEDGLGIATSILVFLQMLVMFGTIILVEIKLAKRY